MDFVNTIYKKTQSEEKKALIANIVIISLMSAIYLSFEFYRILDSYYLTFDKLIYPLLGLLTILLGYLFIFLRSRTIYFWRRMILGIVRDFCFLILGILMFYRIYGFIYFLGLAY